MNLWQWLTANSIPLQSLFAAVGALLTVVTILVLVITWRAVKRQALASEKLIESTTYQISTSMDQAKAAREQVEVARRQITESLRPILLARIGLRDTNNKGEIILHLTVKNEGAGAALDAWWTYGKPNQHPYAGHKHGRLGLGILAPGIECNISVEDKQAFAYGVLIVYRSLSGILSATEIERESVEGKNIYHPDAEKDFNGLSDLTFPESPSQPL